MTKKIVAILMATLMSATMLVGVTTVSARTFVISEDAPGDIELPLVSPHGQMLFVNDENVQKSRGYLNLELGNNDVEYIDDYPDDGDTTVSYEVHNTGTIDITSTFADGTWWRKGLYKWELYVSKDHATGVDAGDSYTDSYDYDFPSEWHWVCTETDCGEDIDEKYESDNEVYTYREFC